MNNTVNPLRRIWSSGRAAIGTYLMYSQDLPTVELAAAAGLDFIVFDLEHRPHEYRTVHDLCQVARLAGLAPIVGPPDISPVAISRALDMGASGVIIPHVETPQEVELAVSAVLYPPLGHRGRAGIAGHNLYRSTRSVAEELDHYNQEVALLLKVESEAAIGRLDELIAPDAVAGVMIGPSDLTFDMGIPGQTDHDRVHELTDRVISACKERGIHYGTYVSSAKKVPEAISSGASWIMVASEMEILTEGWSEASRAGGGSH